MVVKSEHRKQSIVDSPLLVCINVGDALTESVSGDCVQLFDQDSGCLVLNGDFRIEWVWYL